MKQRVRTACVHRVTAGHAAYCHALSASVPLAPARACSRHFEQAHARSEQRRHHFPNFGRSTALARNRGHPLGRSPRASQKNYTDVGDSTLGANFMAVEAKRETRLGGDDDAKGGRSHGQGLCVAARDTPRAVPVTDSTSRPDPISHAGIAGLPADMGGDESGRPSTYIGARLSVCASLTGKWAANCQNSRRFRRSP